MARRNIELDTRQDCNVTGLRLAVVSGCEGDGQAGLEEVGRVKFAESEIVQCQAKEEERCGVGAAWTNLANAVAHKSGRKVRASLRRLLQFAAKGLVQQRVCERIESGGQVGGEESEASRLRDFQLAADGADCAFLDFAMPWNRRDFPVGGVFPDGVVPAFTNQRTTMGAEMALQIEPFHEAAS